MSHQEILMELLCLVTSTGGNFFKKSQMPDGVSYGENPFSITASCSSK